jgi:hypothetical protein
MIRAGFFSDLELDDGREERLARTLKAIERFYEQAHIDEAQHGEGTRSARVPKGRRGGLRQSASAHPRGRRGDKP